MSDEGRAPRNAEEAVEAFLRLVMTHPKKQPKTQRQQHENAVMVATFNRAQETLRDALSQVEGKTKQAERARQLAEVREDGQQRPMAIGGMRVWTT